MVCGLGAWLPPNLVTNDDLAARLDTTDDWIRSRTGIRQRYHVPTGMATSELAVQAGSRAMESAGVSDVDLVVLATDTPDRPVPGTAPTVADRLGLRGRGAVDLNAACSGFLYGLATGAGLIATEAADRVLVIGADANTPAMNPADRNTFPLFGDGAGAVVLRAGVAGEPGALGRFTLGSDGSLADLMTIRAGGSAQRSSRQPPAEEDVYFTMQGRQVFAHAVTRMVESVRTALDLAGWRHAEVDVLVAHQANLRILRAVAEQLDLTPEQVPIQIDMVGNTVGASVALALAHSARSGALRAGQRTVLVSFGAGATWAATTLHWPQIDVSATRFPYEDDWSHA